MTPAVKLLEKAKVPHRVITYHHDPTSTSYGEEAAEATGIDPSRVFKTLVAAIDGSRHVVAVVPVSSRLDLKAIAAAAKGKKAAMADPADAERMTGYVVGGISPLGQKKRLATFVDTSAQGLDLMYVSGGRRGLEIELAPADLVATLNATWADLATG